MSIAVTPDVRTRESPELRQARIDLAAAFRWTARMNMHEGVANHFSLAVSDRGRQFLMNPCGRHFSRIRATDLLLLDADDAQTMTRPDAPDPTAWHIHGRIHARVRRARCVLHVHCKYSTVLASLADSTLYPIDQNTARFFERVALDEAYGGLALDDDEGDRLASALEAKSILLMGNHGVMVTGPSVAHAFDELYYFERSCETLVTAYMTGKKLRILPDNVARMAAEQWANYPGIVDHHFDELKRILDTDSPDYRH